MQKHGAYLTANGLFY